MKFDIHVLNGLTNSQVDQLQIALEAGEKALNSEFFKESVKNFKWTEYRRSWFRKTAIAHNTFNQNNGKSNEQILADFMSGADLFNTYLDEDMDLSLSYYYANNSTVGYTTPNEQTIYVNKKFFLYWLDTKEGLAYIIGNIVHEYMHKMGYDHSFFNNATRQYTVPYAMGDLASAATLRVLNGLDDAPAGSANT